MDLQTMLALYRTHLAERRTALSQLQLGFVLVTVPVTLHAAFMMIADRHSLAGPALLSGTGSAASVVVLAAGLILVSAAIRDLWRCALAIRSMRSRIDIASAAGESAGDVRAFRRSREGREEGGPHGTSRAADHQDRRPSGPTGCS